MTNYRAELQLWPCKRKPPDGQAALIYLKFATAHSLCFPQKEGRDRRLGEHWKKLESPVINKCWKEEIELTACHRERERRGDDGDIKPLLLSTYPHDQGH